MKPLGALLVILNDDDEILLLKRSPKSWWMPNKWGLPGGIVEESEDPPFTAVRETFEETHLKVDIEDLVLLSSDKKVAIYLSIVYNGDVIIDYEHSDWAWVKQEDMTNYDAVPHILEWFEKALKYDKK